MVAIYNTVDVLVNPHSTALLTARYVFPSKLLEYLASGRPVITTATPEIAADYRDLCTVLDREEPQALADAILRVAAMSAADRLARAGKVRVAIIERRAWSRQGRRLVRFLEEQTRPFGIGAHDLVYHQIIRRLSAKNTLRDPFLHVSLDQYPQSQMKIPILKIPFYEEDRKFIEAGIETILTSGELTMGRYTGQFEEQFADFVGSRFAIACSNGTAALELILRGLGSRVVRS